MTASISGNGQLVGIIQMPETVTLTATAAPATISYDTNTQSILYYTVNNTANFIINFRGDGANTYNSISSVGQSMSFVLLVTNGTTPFLFSAIQIDGVAITPKWQGGAAPTAGNANSTDIYNFTIIKTAATPTYTVLASMSKFA